MKATPRGIKLNTVFFFKLTISLSVFSIKALITVLKSQVMNQDIILIIGLSAGACTTFSFIPQVYHIWKRQSAHDISGAMYSIFSIGSLLWLLYGIGMHSIPVTLANAFTLALNLFILALKWKFSRLKNTG